MHPFALLGSIPHALCRAEGALVVIVLGEDCLHVYLHLAFRGVIDFLRCQKKPYSQIPQNPTERDEILNISGETVYRVNDGGIHLALSLRAICKHSLKLRPVCCLSALAFFLEDPDHLIIVAVSVSHARAELGGKTATL
ncbi:hypothetical protein PMW78_00395 [Eggerthella lenta]|nr:hypothetical protein [Eggerthella lenta]MDB1768845.1 hypothetical protein [Eggerthella lenta]